MAVNHFCSQCGAFSQHETALTFAVDCLRCGHVEPQNPHTPDLAVAAELAASSGQPAVGVVVDEHGPREARGTITVSSGTTRRRKARAAQVADEPVAKADGGKLSEARAAELTDEINRPR